MLQDEDLEAAIAEGIVTTAQAAALRELAHKRDKARAIELGHEERFRFMRGFNDFFFAVGIVLFGGGLGFFALPTPAGTLVAALVIWALAELLVGRLRLVLPGIFLAAFFVAYATAAAPVDLWFLSPGQLDFAQIKTWFTSTRLMDKYFRSGLGVPELILLLYALVGAAAAALFYLRFKLPFALLLVAGCLVGAALASLHLLLSPARALQYHTLALLGCGLLTFAAAMAFDMSDRERLTRRADCAFWLHLLAAPLIVHSLIRLVTPEFANLTSHAASTIIAIFVGLTIVAVLIDRRALLVSALIYMGSVIAYAITQTVDAQPSRQSFVFFATLLVLGALVLTIGVGWRPLRRLFLRIVPAFLGKRLPPEAVAA